MIDIGISDDVSEIPMDEPSSFALIGAMLLTIAGLALTSYMLFHYATDAVKTENDEPAFTFISFLEMMGDSQTPTSERADESIETAPLETEMAKLETKEENPEKKRSFFSKNTFKRWPTLTVTGYGTSTKSGGFAIINGQQVMLNDYIDGAQLIEIRSQDVVLEFEGERKNIAIDQ